MNLLENSELRWKHFLGGEDFDYPINYWAALLHATDDGHVDLLYRGEANCYCHFHRHTARTTSTVLAGELNVVDIDLETGKESNHRVRSAGDYACKEPGDVHMEYGGPDGAVVLFNIYSPDGILAESLSRDRQVLGTSRLDDILQGKALRSGVA